MANITAKCVNCGEPVVWYEADNAFFHEPLTWGRNLSNRDKHGDIRPELPYNNGYWCQETMKTSADGGFNPNERKSMSEQRLPDYIGYNTKVGKLLDLQAITPLILSHEQDGIFLPFTDEVRLLQYSGVDDIDGKKIYEDFIVENGSARWLVVFDRGCFSGKIVSPVHLRREEPPHMPLRVIQGARVIGNIHQNPELLK
jgi:hypothetical protein